MAATLVELHQVIVVEWRAYMDAQEMTLVVCFLDLLMRNLLVVGLLQHGIERVCEVAALVGERTWSELALGFNLGVEVEIVVFELLEPGKVLEMVDRTKQLAEPTNILGLRAQCALLHERRDDLALADRDELIAPRRAITRAASCVRHGSRPLHPRSPACFTVARGSARGLVPALGPGYEPTCDGKQAVEPTVARRAV